MSIHYENYKAFSRGQGFIGSACRPIGGPMATTLRWFACDCPKCKLTLLGRRVVSRDGVTGRVAEVHHDRVLIDVGGEMLRSVMFCELDTDWALLNLDEIFSGRGCRA